MTKAELIDRVANAISKSTEISKKATGQIIDLTFAEMAKALRKEKRFATMKKMCV